MLDQNKRIDIGKKYNTFLSIKMQALLEGTHSNQLSIENRLNQANYESLGTNSSPKCNKFSKCEKGISVLNSDELFD